MGNIEFASKVHLGVISNTRVAKRIAISLFSGAKEADICCYISLQVDMGVTEGNIYIYIYIYIYNGLQLTQHFNPDELRRESIRTLLWVNMK